MHKTYHDFDKYMRKLDPVGGYLSGKFGKEKIRESCKRFSIYIWLIRGVYYLPILNGTFDEDYPIVKKKAQERLRSNQRRLSRFWEEDGFSVTGNPAPAFPRCHSCDF